MSPMKRKHAVILLLAFAGAAGLLTPRARPENAAEAGKAVVPIYLPPALFEEAQKPGVDVTPSFMDPGPERLYGWALRDLRDYLQRMTKAQHPFAKLDPQAKGGVFAGTFDQFPDFKPAREESRKALASADPEAFVVEVQGDKLFLLGKSPHGLTAAIYTFLDKLGCKWFAPGKVWENVPDLNGLTLDARLNAASAGPSYQLRWFAVSWGPDVSVFRKEDRAKQAEWLRRNRQGGSAYAAIYHNDPNIVPPALFETRPELFALVQGKRNPYGLSRANPETVETAVASAVKYLKANDGKGTFYNSFSVETNDGSPPCEWSLKQVGNHTATDLNYWFANQVAAGVEKAGLQDKWVGMCSYSDHAALPSFDLHPQVAVSVTTGLAFAEAGGPIDLTVEQRLDGLRKRKCRRVGVYDYPNLVTWSLEKPGCAPACKPLEFAARLKSYHEHGATTYVGETSDSWVMSGAGHYLAGRLLWDVEGDPGKELDAYYDGAFGPAAKEIRALYEDWEGYILVAGALPRMTRERCALWSRLIAAADRRANGNPVYQARVNAVKRYYLYLNLTRELEIDIQDPKLPSKTERYGRLLRYVASNRGEGVFHGYGLFYTLAEAAKAAPGVPGVRFDRLDADLIAVTKKYYDEEVWKAFPPIGDADVDKMFEEAKLPLDGRAGGRTLDPVLKVFPPGASPPAELKFPKLHGPPAVVRRYVLKVVAPTPKLTFQIVAGAALGGGEDRTCVVTGPEGKEIKRFAFKTGDPAGFELADLKPGVYVATFPERGMEQLTVTGGNTFGAVEGFQGDGWGFNAFRRSEQGSQAEVSCYFLIPAGRQSLKAGLWEGTVSLGFQGGGVIAAEVKGAAKKSPEEFKFPPADKPRIAYLKWGRDFPSSAGMVVEGVTLYSPDPSYVLYETLD